jgi:transposase
MTDTSTNAIIIGVDTHKATHVVVAIDTNGSRRAAFSVPATTKGYLALEDWACAIGAITAFGIEGTASYGAGLSRYLLARAIKSLRSPGLIDSCAISMARPTA